MTKDPEVNKVIESIRVKANKLDNFARFNINKILDSERKKV